VGTLSHSVAKDLFSAGLTEDSGALLAFCDAHKEGESAAGAFMAGAGALSDIVGPTAEDDRTLTIGRVSAAAGDRCHVISARAPGERLGLKHAPATADGAGP
jgi:hypothetical protein